MSNSYINENSDTFNTLQGAVNSTEEKITYSLLSDVEETRLIFNFYDDETIIENEVDSYISGSGNNFRADDGLFQDLTLFPNDVVIVEQGTIENEATLTAYQNIQNFQTISNIEMLNYNFRLTQQDRESVFSRVFLNLKNDFKPLVGEDLRYDFKFAKVKKIDLSNTQIVTTGSANTSTTTTITSGITY